MKTIIVDDNKIARATLSQLSARINDLEVVGECEDAFEAHNLLMENRVDLLLLDIEMPGMTGLELTKNLGKNKPLIIFTTSKKDYAAEAFELNVVDYIVKPVMPARFIAAIDKAREIFESNKVEATVDADAFIFIRDSNVIRRLNLDEIWYFEAMGDYVKIHTAQKFYAIHTTLKAVEEKLPASTFIRVHRSFIVTLSHVETLQDGALVIHGKTVPVADAYKNSLNKRMKIL